MNVKITALLLFFCLGITACKGKKGASSNKTPSVAELLSGKIADNELNADWLSTSLQINANDGSRSQSFAADMRWHKNEAIWLSAYPNIGIKIEVARAFITPDSVRVIDRFNRQYHAHPISYLQTLTGYPIDFNTLQRIISGSRLLAPDLPTKTDTLPDAFILKTDRNTLHESVKLNNTDYTATQLSLTDDFTEQSIQIALDNYKPVNGKAFSHQRKIGIHSKAGNYQADVRFSGVTVHSEPLEMPFSVGAKYK